MGRVGSKGWGAYDLDSEWAGEYLGVSHHSHSPLKLMTQAKSKGWEIDVHCFEQVLQCLVVIHHHHHRYYRLKVTIERWRETMEAGWVVLFLDVMKYRSYLP